MHRHPELDGGEQRLKGAIRVYDEGAMPRKIRELKADLRKAGYRQIPGRGKGSHTWWEHPKVPGYAVDLSGHDGDDAKSYQERAVREAQARAPKKK